ncbi:hypothetical protein [Chondrinema litorale]|uniref:hypothetical protein n=1 Tax=Chondrinema litorale TaxID=2994555 RepID=UPI002542ECD0|nr:hypothetical protein [Chondrinema litorale]UZR97060.1 hypothetical protein OQ292_23460 [Chondrinema litorale]
MKKISILNWLLVLSLFYFTACNKDDEEIGELEETFPEATAESHKSTLEQTGIDFTTELENMKDIESVNYVVTLLDFFDLDDPFDDDSEPVVNGRRSATYFLHDIKAFSLGKLTLKDLAKGRIAEGGDSIEEAFDSIKGTYTWNSSTSEWDFTEGGDKVIFEFPSEEGGTTNNAVFTIHNYAGVTISGNPLEENEDYTGDLPAELDADLVIDGTTVMEYGFDISYNTDGVPTSVSTTLSLSPYSLTYSLTNSTSEITSGYKLQKGDSNIIAVNLGVSGNFDIDNIESSADDEDISGVVSAGEVSLQLYDIKFVADLSDVEGLADELDAIEAKQDNDDYEGAALILETAMNDHLSFKVKYASKNEIIAVGVFEGIVMEDTYTYYEWDADAQDWIEYEAVDTWIEPNMILQFGDDSKVSIDTYFEEGFEDLEQAIEDLLESID